MAKKRARAVLASPFDVTRVEIIYRGETHTRVKIIEGAMQGQIISVSKEMLHSSKEYRDLHNQIYH